MGLGELDKLPVHYAPIPVGLPESVSVSYTDSASLAESSWQLEK